MALGAGILKITIRHAKTTIPDPGNRARGRIAYSSGSQATGTRR